MENPALGFLFDLATAQMDQFDMGAVWSAGAFLLVRLGLMSYGLRCRPQKNNRRWVVNTKK